MRIQITAPGEYTSLDNLLVGEYYEVEPLSCGTNAQNRAFHALMQEYFTSGLHSYPVKTFDEFRDCVKRDLGAGFEAYIYIDLEGHKRKSKVFPVDVMEHNGERYLWGKLKSWSNYTRKERKEAIDRLLSEMLQAGVSSRKFHEIVEGMDGIWNEPKPKKTA
jgi:hypothetical protein